MLQMVLPQISRLKYLFCTSYQILLVLNPINRGFCEVTVVFLPICSEFSLGTPHSFFILFCVVLTIVKSLNSSIFRRKSRLTKVFPKIFALHFSGFGVKWKFISLIFLPAKILCLRKLWYLSYGPKYSQPIRSQDSRITYVSSAIWSISVIFCMLR